MDRHEFFILFCREKGSVYITMIKFCAISVSLWEILHTENGASSLFLIFKFKITQKRDLIARNGKRSRNPREKYF